MKKEFGVYLMIFLVCFLSGGSAFADQKEEVQDLCKKGAAYLKTNGAEKAAAAFATDEFKKGELYLFAYNFEAVCLAQGANPSLVGKDMSKLRTPEGDFLLQTLAGIAKKGGGWHEYRWMHETKKKLLGKVSYIMPIDGMNAFVGCGYWKE
jgi:cytochrome c